VFENKLLRRIFGSKREKVAEGWRRLHNEELHNLYLYVSPNIIRVIKSRMVSLTGRIATDERNEKCVQNCSLNILMEDVTWKT
jgi:hypothetical protein